MEVIHNILTWNEILTVSILGWLTAQLIKTTISSLLAGKLQLERMVGDGGMPSAHSATVCAMVVATGRIEGVHSTLFAVACVVAIITMHDAMGVRHETGEQAKVLNNIIAVWLEESETLSPFLQNMRLKEMVGHTPLQVYAGMIVGAAVGDEALHRADAQAVFAGEGDEVGQAGHGAVLADNLAADAGGLEAGEAREVDGRLGVAGAAEHAAGLRPQGEGVAGRHEVGRRRRIVHQELDGFGAVGGGDAGGDAGVGGAVHAQGEGGGETVAAVHARRQRDAQAVEEGPIAGGAEQPAGLADAEVDGLGGDLFGGHDEVAFVFALRVIHNDDEFTGPDILQARFHRVQRGFQILFHGANLSGPLV